MKHKEKYRLLFILISFRLLFVFTDAIFSHKKNKEESQAYPQQNESQITSNVTEELSRLWISSWTIQETSLQNVQSKKIGITEDIRMLENMYQQNKRPEIFKILIQKLIQNHQFVQARQYLLATTFQEGWVDATTYLYVLFNSMQLTTETDKEYIKWILEQYKNGSIITQDDYDFYRWLLSIRDHNYQNSELLFKKVQDTKYRAIIDQIQAITTAAKQQKDMPSYYQDCLVWLSLLKNGYFSIAKKLAMDSASKNDKYILPYQILAYAEFLTNNYESAMTYFLKLKDNDPQNVQMYTFYIGICNYWIKAYNDALLYLDQVALPQVKTDVYRYELLIYIATNNIKQQITTWHKILWQEDIQKEDFYQFFYEVIYRPITIGQPAEVYLTNPEMWLDVLSLCYEKVPQEDQDVCLYGEVWLDGIKVNRWAETKNKLLYLVDKYPNTYTYDAIANYYASQNQFEQAKTYYLKAISSATNQEEKNYIKSKIIEQIVIE